VAIKVLPESPSRDRMRFLINIPTGDAAIVPIAVFNSMAALTN
jgi:hypothetical protein